jgi:hypothetical protein
MLHQHRATPIQETLGQSGQQIQAPIGFPQQQPTAISGNGAPIKSGYHFARKMGCELESRLGTLCHSKGRFLLDVNCCVETQLCQKRRLFATPGEKCGLAQVSGG